MLKRKLNLEFYTQTIQERWWKKDTHEYTKLERVCLLPTPWKVMPDRCFPLAEAQHRKKETVQETLDGGIDKNVGNSKYKLV